MTLLLVCAALIAMLAAAVVSGFETGIYALSHIRLRYRLSMGDPRAKILERLIARPQQLLTGILVAQNVAVYCTTAIVTSAFERAEIPGAESLGTLLLAVVLFIFVEATPKNVWRRAADILVYPAARPLSYLIMLMRPAGAVLGVVTRLVNRLGATGGISDPLFTRERLAYYLREGQSEGILSNYQVELTANILRGERVTVARAMVPLEKVVAVGEGTTLEQFAETSAIARFSRYPVYSGAKENIRGILNIYDCRLKQTSIFDMGKLIRQAVFFAPDVHVTDAIRSLRDARQPMGVVAKDGRALGIVTLKDCLEEIVGELYAW